MARLRVLFLYLFIITYWRYVLCQNLDNDYYYSVEQTSDEPDVNKNLTKRSADDNVTHVHTTNLNGNVKLTTLQVLKSVDKSSIEITTPNKLLLQRRKLLSNGEDALTTIKSATDVTESTSLMDGLDAITSGNLPTTENIVIVTPFKIHTIRDDFDPTERIEIVTSVTQSDEDEADENSTVDDDFSKIFATEHEESTDNEYFSTTLPSSDLVEAYSTTGHHEESTDEEANSTTSDKDLTSTVVINHDINYTAEDSENIEVTPRFETEITQLQTTTYPNIDIDVSTITDNCRFEFSTTKSVDNDATTAIATIVKEAITDKIDDSFSTIKIDDYYSTTQLIVEDISTNSYKEESRVTTEENTTSTFSINDQEATEKIQGEDVQFLSTTNYLTTKVISTSLKEENGVTAEQTTTVKEVAASTLSIESEQIAATTTNKVEEITSTIENEVVRRIDDEFLSTSTTEIVEDMSTTTNQHKEESRVTTGQSNDRAEEITSTITNEVVRKADDEFLSTSTSEIVEDMSTTANQHNEENRVTIEQTTNKAEDITSTLTIQNKKVDDELLSFSTTDISTTNYYEENRTIDEEIGEEKEITSTLTIQKEKDDNEFLSTSTTEIVEDMSTTTNKVEEITSTIENEVVGRTDDELFSISTTEIVEDMSTATNRHNEQTDNRAEEITSTLTTPNEVIRKVDDELLSSSTTDISTTINYYEENRAIDEEIGEEKQITSTLTIQNERVNDEFLPTSTREIVEDMSITTNSHNEESSVTTEQTNNRAELVPKADEEFLSTSTTEIVEDISTTNSYYEENRAIAAEIFDKTEVTSTLTVDNEEKTTITTDLLPEELTSSSAVRIEDITSTTTVTITIEEVPTVSSTLGLGRSLVKSNIENNEEQIKYLTDSSDDILFTTESGGIIKEFENISPNSDKSNDNFENNNLEEIEKLTTEAEKEEVGTALYSTTIDDNDIENILTTEAASMFTTLQYSTTLKDIMEDMRTTTELQDIFTTLQHGEKVTTFSSVKLLEDDKNSDDLENITTTTEFEEITDISTTQKLSQSEKVVTFSSLKDVDENEAQIFTTEEIEAESSDQLLSTTTELPQTTTEVKYNSDYSTPIFSSNTTLNDLITTSTEASTIIIEDRREFLSTTLAETTTDHSFSTIKTNYEMLNDGTTEFKSDKEGENITHVTLAPIALNTFNLILEINNTASESIEDISSFLNPDEDFLKSVTSETKIEIIETNQDGLIKIEESKEIDEDKNDNNLIEDDGNIKELLKEDSQLTPSKFIDDRFVELEITTSVKISEDDDTTAAIDYSTITNKIEITESVVDFITTQSAIKAENSSARKGKSENLIVPEEVNDKTITIEFDAEEFAQNASEEDAAMADPQVSAMKLGEMKRFSVKIAENGSNFFIPPDAFVFFNDDNSMNITWKSSIENLNNSLWLDVKNFGKRLQLNIMKGNQMQTHKNAALGAVPQNKSNITHIITLGDDIQVSFSNLDFLDIEPESNASISLYQQKAVEILSGSLGALVIIGIVIYYVSKKIRNRARVFKPNSVA